MKESRMLRKRNYHIYLLLLSTFCINPLLRSSDSNNLIRPRPVPPVGSGSTHTSVFSPIQPRNSVPMMPITDSVSSNDASTANSITHISDSSSEGFASLPPFIRLNIEENQDNNLFRDNETFNTPYASSNQINPSYGNLSPRLSIPEPNNNTAPVSSSQTTNNNISNTSLPNMESETNSFPCPSDPYSNEDFWGNLSSLLIHESEDDTCENQSLQNSSIPEPNPSASSFLNAPENQNRNILTTNEEPNRIQNNSILYTPPIAAINSESESGNISDTIKNTQAIIERIFRMRLME